MTKQLLLKDKKKTGETPQPTGKTKTELLHKYQHQDWMLKDNTRTTKTEILSIVPECGIFLCVCLFCFLFVCLCMFVHLTLLISFFFSFVMFFVFLFLL
jgi:hypothetical protein